MLGPRCLYYALGGGLGHGVRSLALARQLQRQIGGQHRLLWNSSFAPTLQCALNYESELEASILSANAPPHHAGEFLAAEVRSFQPDLLVVDTFPRGLGGELVQILPDLASVRRVLVSRTLPAAYVEQFELVSFTRQHYDLVLVPGEPGPFGGQLPVEHMEPFYIRDYEELLPEAEAATLLRTTPGTPVVLFVGSGTPGECAEWLAWSQRLYRSWPATFPPLRCAMPAGIGRQSEECSPLVVMHFPLLNCCRAIRLVIGSAGYNLVNEMHAVGVPAFFQPRPRRYDQQQRRVYAEELFPLKGDILSAIERILHQPQPPATRYRNGAKTAATRIVKLLLQARR